MTAPDRPTTDTDSEAWWAAVQDDALMVNACRSCDRNSLYPRPFCPYCWSEDVAPVAAGGSARLYTWSVIHQRGRDPYIVAMVDLAEGPRLMTTIEGCAPDGLRADMGLTLAFRREEDGFAVPVFRPAS